VDMDTGGAALARATAREWMDDMTEAAAVGAAIGDRVLIVTLSTGGTLAALAAERGLLPDAVAGIVFVSPNFRMANPLAGLITAPGAQWWLPVIGGRTRSFEPENAAHGEWWTTTYPSAAVFPLGAAVDRARAADYSGVGIPALFAFDPADAVIDHEASRAVAERWGGGADLVELDVVGDPSRHIAAGDILSPRMTAPVADLILRWAEGL
ncbi:MAG: alpha/beta hydrolase, partial [Hasllibacter sp.]